MCHIYIEERFQNMQGLFVNEPEISLFKIGDHEVTDVKDVVLYRDKLEIDLKIGRNF